MRVRELARARANDLAELTVLHKLTLFFQLTDRSDLSRAHIAQISNQKSVLRRYGIHKSHSMRSTCIYVKIIYVCYSFFHRKKHRISFFSRRRRFFLTFLPLNPTDSNKNVRIEKEEQQSIA